MHLAEREAFVLILKHNKMMYIQEENYELGIST